jgi:DNA helicase-2/ATP-dependent DNA helicase PcrA
MLYGQTHYNSPSRFLKEVPKEYIETVSLREPAARQSKPVTRQLFSKPQPFAIKPAAKPIPAPNPYLHTLSEPKDKPLDFSVGDRVRQAKYGVGTVSDIRPAGADYEVTVQFEEAGTKKFMAHLSRLVRE